MNALPYQQPLQETLLPLSSFLLALHIAAWPLDKLFSCGLIMQILIGIVWGPLTSWLALDVQRTIVQLGYIGLVLLVYEGGLRTDLKLLKEYFIISVLVALTGILLPIALSFILIPMFWSPTISPLTAFTAGASLCSTSLGTAYAILSAARLERTRIGTVLVAAAMMDDVVGLIMVSVVSSLTNTVDARTVGRPIGVSFAFLFASLMVMRYFPHLPKRFTNPSKKLHFQGLGFVVSGLALFGLVAAAGYAGTSILFVGYLTGISATYLFEVLDEDGLKNPALDCYERYYAGISTGLLLPFFFASMGFAIPLGQLFHGPVVWRGMVYTVLMALGKCATSVWLFAFPVLTKFINKVRTKIPQSNRNGQADNVPKQISPSSVHPPSQVFPDSEMASKSIISDDLDTSNPPIIQRNTILAMNYDNPDTVKTSQKYIYAVLLLSFAMTTRGEIGFLIAAVGQSIDILAPEEVYLVVIWAVILCTLLGSIGVGIVVFFIKKAAARLGVGPSEILGVWG